MQKIFRALGDPHRFAMVRMLRKRPLHVQAVADGLGITQPAVSRHAKVLRDAGLIDMVRSGRCTLLRCPPLGRTPRIERLLRLVWEDGSADRPASAMLDQESAPGTAKASPKSPRSDDLEDFLL